MRVRVPSLARVRRGNSSVVELHLAKVEVAGSNPVSRYTQTGTAGQEGTVAIFYLSYRTNG